MSIIMCSECGKEISDKANTCPHCGCPIGSINNSQGLIIGNVIDTERLHNENNLLLKEITEKYPATKKKKMIKELRKSKNLTLKEAEEVINTYLKNGQNILNLPNVEFRKIFQDKQRKKSMDSIKSFLIFIGILFLLVLPFLVNKEESSNEPINIVEEKTENETKVEKTEPTTKNAEIKNEEEVQNVDNVENTFVSQLSEYMDVQYAENLNDIYLNKLGFETVEFKERLGETENYSITANGYYTVATVMDDYVRIFAPNTDYVFYEDGEVIMTFSDYKDGQIEASEMPYYYSIAQIIVENCLKSPKSADFPNSDKISYQKKDNLVAIKGYVDADNSFGAKIRSDYIVQFYVTDLQNLLYEVTYVEVDGEKSGEFINIE